MARPRRLPIDRIRALSHHQNGHLIWDGEMRRSGPHLSRVGNPARILLGLTDHADYQIRRDREICNESGCIEPHHFRVMRERRFKYSDLPNTPWRDPRHQTNELFTDRELAEIVESVEQLRLGQLAVEDLDFFPLHLRLEILTRSASCEGQASNPNARRECTAGRPYPNRFPV